MNKYVKISINHVAISEHAGKILKKRKAYEDGLEILLWADPALSKANKWNIYYRGKETTAKTESATLVLKFYL